MSGTKTQYEAVIIGSGPSGIAAACQLQSKLGLTKIKMFERGGDFGGTWYHNRYAGAACDVPPRLYSFSFNQKKFNTDVYAAEWIEEATHWKVKYRSLDSDDHGEITARVLVNSSGILSVPRDCDVDGWENFKGPLFHSAKWDTSVDLTNKNVVVLGNGCSATQIVPAIAKQVKSVTQVIRAKHWYAPTPIDLFGSKTIKWMQRYIPGWIYLERSLISFSTDATFMQAWNHEGKGARERFAYNSNLYVSTVAPKKYHHLLLPTQEELQVACKRRVYDSAYIPSLNLDNVELTDDQAVRITEDSVILKSGKVLKADVVILASGFKTGETTVQTKIVGRNGKELSAWWQKRGYPHAYRTALVHDFPSLFLLCNANSATGHFSALYSIESTIRFMTTLLKPIFLTGPKALSPLERSAGRTVSVKAEAQEKDDALISGQMKDLIYTSGCSGWYHNASGRVSTLYPGFQFTFAWRSDYPVADDLVYTGVTERPSSTWSYAQQIASFFKLGDVPEYRSAKLKGRPWLLKLFFDPLWAVVYRANVYVMLMTLWLLDKFMFYTRGTKDFIELKEQWLASQ